MIVETLLSVFLAANEPRCLDREHYILSMEGQYAEIPLVTGTVDGKRITMVLFANGTSRTWTIASFDGETLCTILSGTDLHSVTFQDGLVVEERKINENERKDYE